MRIRYVLSPLFGMMRWERIYFPWFNLIFFSGCPSGYQRYGTSAGCYMLSGSGMSHPNSRAFCTQHGGELASLNDPHEYQAVRGWLADNGRITCPWVGKWIEARLECFFLIVPRSCCMADHSKEASSVISAFFDNAPMRNLRLIIEWQSKVYFICYFQYNCTWYT